MRSVDDLTARARIRDAAMLRFGRDGFGVGLRQVAADAGVSPALVLHHFGSKDGLREACDRYVHDELRAVKSDALDRPAGDVMAELAGTEQYAPLVAYLVRVVLDGGPGAAAFVDGLVADTVAYLEHGERAGAVRPTSDPQGRARYVVAGQLGLLLLAQLEAAAGRAPSPTTDTAAALAHITTTSMQAGLEIFTHGLLADSAYLDAWRAGEGAVPATREQP
ncbi:TetR family transcriptional regulator [Cellulomonas wangsupingiae]|uniref:TetR family transcriptional regulator n=1 Tax=Cellulomonas wangsupingiae TaxID=2968085 RepID=A0ABY5K7E6_9CELL|nr:TetR family transcriptional regulator [Cellulomonas wangsupingiae]MCC2336318.1 TetR family transcriptional regulator [Cellulomonas wangsupingiae]UUI65703.1 TetR family transcriptional regulator [Cellulomonas wangsupingiae]